MQKVVDEAILLNTFSKTAQLHLENYSWSYFSKKKSSFIRLYLAQLSFTNEVFF